MVSLPFPMSFFLAFSGFLGAQMEEYLQGIPLNVFKDSAFYFFDYCIAATFA